MYWDSYSTISYQPGQRFHFSWIPSAGLQIPSRSPANLQQIFGDSIPTGKSTMSFICRVPACLQKTQFPPALSLAVNNTHSYAHQYHSPASMQWPQLPQNLMVPTLHSTANRICAEGKSVQLFLLITLPWLPLLFSQRQNALTWPPGCVCSGPYLSSFVWYQLLPLTPLSFSPSPSPVPSFPLFLSLLYLHSLSSSCTDFSVPPITTFSPTPGLWRIYAVLLETPSKSLWWYQVHHFDFP